MLRLCRGGGGRRALPRWAAVSTPSRAPSCGIHASPITLNKQDAAPHMEEYPPELIRNFSIIAHIDHGKSTLADRMMEATGLIKASSSNKQVLDKLDVERQRGITVKANTVSMFHTHTDGRTYLLNLIDTPGHVDFSYEVSRSLAACQGALLLVDGAQGVQAQTMANFFLAFAADLVIVPVINKIDLDTADPARVADELQQTFDFPPEEALLASAKTGIGLDEIFTAIVERMNPPEGKCEGPKKLLLFDSWYDEHRGVICLVNVVDGTVVKGDKIISYATSKRYDVFEVGIISPGQVPCDRLCTGQVGYVILNMRTAADAKVGDTLYDEDHQVEPFPGFQAPKPMVFAGVYPLESSMYAMLTQAMEKITLTDASVSYRKESSDALGPGFRCGFLGLLHLEVFQQRLEQEYEADVLVTAPTVPFKFNLTCGEELIVENPAQFPRTDSIAAAFEPIVASTIIIPANYMGDVLSLCHTRRGVQKEVQYLSDSRVILKFDLPLTEIVSDFYADLKANTSGYASFDYEDPEWQPAPLAKLEILLNGEAVDAMSFIVHKSQAQSLGKHYVAKLKNVIKRQMFQVQIQAKVGSKIIASERLQAFRKDVTAKLYGGDVTRKKKLLEKQKQGKKRMKALGSVSVPQEAFAAIVKR